MCEWKKDKYEVWWTLKCKRVRGIWLETFRETLLTFPPMAHPALLLNWLPSVRLLPLPLLLLLLASGLHLLLTPLPLWVTAPLFKNVFSSQFLSLKEVYSSGFSLFLGSIPFPPKLQQTVQQKCAFGSVKWLLKDGRGMCCLQPEPPRCFTLPHGGHCQAAAGGSRLRTD